MINSHLLVSIVTPNLNQGQFIEATLESVAVQGYPAIEHIVVDGGSTDATIEILRDWRQHPIKWSSQPDRGQADAIRRGLAMATGDIVTWLNSDDIYLDATVLSDVVSVFESGATVVSGAGRYISVTGEFLSSIPVQADRLDYQTLRCVDWVLQPATFMRADLMRAHSLDTRLHYAFDWDLFIRLSREAAFVPIERELAGYRLHDAGKTVSGGHRRREELLLVTRRYNGRYSIRSMVMFAYTRLHDVADALPGGIGRTAGRGLRAFLRATQVLTNGKGIEI